MSIELDRRQLQSKLITQADAARRAADLRNKEARKRVDAARAEQGAARSSGTSGANSKRREAERALAAANKFGKDASALETKAAKYGAEAAKLQEKIAKAEAAEAKKNARQQALAARAAEQERLRTSQRISSNARLIETVDAKAESALRALKTPSAEKLRILMLGASPGGDLRINREHKRIRRAVEVAAHRDQVDIDVHLSATTQDLQEGIAKFRPHIVHFAGHGEEELISFEEDVDDFHEGVVVSASAFASACQATDHPPSLIVLNACESASTAIALVERFAPLAIGMTGSIDDGDALYYATALYSSVANGQSVQSAHLAGKAAIELAGGEHELPVLVTVPGIDPGAVILVHPAPREFE